MLMSLIADTPGRLLIAVCLLVAASWPAAAQNPNVTVNEQPTAEQRLQEINELRRGNRYDTAAELVQTLIEDSAMKLVGVGGGRYTDAERWCREELLRDGALREAYRQRYTASATRALEQALAADEPLEAVTAVYRLYTATTPGMEAGLQRAGRLLEAGEISAAAQIVEALGRHPDRDVYAGRLVALRGAVAAFQIDQAGVADARAALDEMGFAAERDGLDQLQDAIGPEIVSAVAGLVDAGEKPEELSLSLWEQPLADVEDASRWLRDASVLPTVTASRVLINNGRQVVAMDRASGQRLWAYPGDDAGPVTEGIRGQRWYDTRTVARGSGVLAAVLGECYGIIETRNPSVRSNRLVCMDEASGQVRWERESGSLEAGEPTEDEGRRIGRANLQYTHFVGTPVITNGQVFVLLRRANSYISQTTWLMSYDLETGKLRWFRHLAMSSLSYSNDAMRVMPTLMLDGETLYISDSIASVAAIDTRTGGYRWLRVLPVGFGPNDRLKIETDGLINPPVMTSVGLLVPLAINGDRLILLDADDGSTLRELKPDAHPRIGGAQYLMSTGDGAIVVSLTSVSYWRADTAAVEWSFAFDAAERVKGRGDVTQGFVLVPTSKRLVVLDRATGALIGEADPPSGNIVVTDTEVFTTSEDKLYSYTSWERSYQRLVAQAEDRATDPTSGLALAALALRRGGQEAALMQGVGYALRALDLLGRESPQRAALTRQRVFSQLRALAVTRQAIDDTTRRRLYDKLALATQTAAQEVAYHLDVGAFYAQQEEPHLALEHFQAVVAEPAFASQAYEHDGQTRSAGAVALEQLQGLIAKHGRSIYSRYDALARARLAELLEEPRADPAAFAVIARRYPMSPAAVEALLEAGRKMQDQGNRTAATGLYQQAVVQAKRLGQHELAVGRLLVFYIDTQRPDAARTLLDRETRLDPDLYPVDGDKPLSPAQWKERIAAVQVGDRLRPDLAADFNTPFLLKGRLLAADDGIAPRALRDRLLLLHQDRSLTCHAAANPVEKQWTAQLPEQGFDWQVLADGDEQTLLWSPDAGWLVALSSKTGALQWSEPLRFTHQSFDQPQALQAERDVLVAVSDAVVAFGERESARVIAIDRSSGGVLWRTELELGQLTALTADAWTLVAAGRSGPFVQQRSGRLILLNLFNGEAATDATDIRVEGVPFEAMIRGDRVLLAAQTGVSCYDLVSGGERWTRRMGEESLVAMAATAGAGVLVVADDSGVVHAFDAQRAGRPAGQVLLRGRSAGMLPVLHAVDQGVWVLGGRSLYSLGRNPLVRWRDSLSMEAHRTTGALIGRQRVALFTASADDGDVADQRQPKANRMFVFDREAGRLQAEFTLAPVGEADGQDQLDPTRARLLGQGFAVPAGWQTLVVPAKP